LGTSPCTRIGFGGREAAGLMRDWCHVAWTGEYHPAVSQLNYELPLKKLDLPVLALTFAADKWAPEAATKALMSEVTRRKPSHRHLSAAETDVIAIDHHSRINRPDLVAPLAAKFIRKSV
jgi:predicted alpha/beta hydrolase